MLSLLVNLVTLIIDFSVIGGTVSGIYFKQMGGEKWAWNVVLVATLFTVPFVLVFAYANTVDIALINFGGSFFWWLLFYWL